MVKQPQTPGKGPHQGDGFGGSAYEFDVAPPDGAKSGYVRWGGRQVHEPGESLELGLPQLGILKYCITGTGVMEAGSTRWQIEPGMILWTAANHKCLLKVGTEPMETFCLAMGDDEALSAMEQCLQIPAGASRLREPGRVISVIEALMEEGQVMTEHRTHNCQLLGRLLMRRIDASVMIQRASNGLARQTYNRCREYIERHFLAIATLKEVADACDVTVPYLCRLFDQFYPQSSPYEYLRSLKMLRAESLLLRMAMPVRDIAKLVGYKDARLFTRNFRAQYGMTPSQYREELENYKSDGHGGAPLEAPKSE